MKTWTMLCWNGNAKEVAETLRANWFDTAVAVDDNNVEFEGSKLTAAAVQTLCKQKNFDVDICCKEVLSHGVVVYVPPISDK